ncbi:MAG TPA: xylulokinase [Candidatus Limivivens merdigallinarum]|uniref:Xylulose kinase n=1 Tax=Candidatus Limivivens merdigallinarum TaxID=2840859 RepID=A0A9D0ZWL9_9FIRM|nr:xylulokinase [Candidatus Limivivens merdigallinarum]
MYYIGIDLGTSAVKLLLMDQDGRIQKIVSKEYPLYFPHPGWSEQNPSDWYEKTIEGIQELTEGVDRTKVSGISFGGQMHGLVALDAEDHILRPAILWNDGRTQEETDDLNNTVGKETLSRCTANIAFAGFTAPKILWMKKHEPELFEKIAKIMLPKDYLAYRLSGTFCTDYSDASGMLLLDVEHKCWSEEMINICGIRRDQLPTLYESFEVVGTLHPHLADQLGLPKDVKIVAGAGDNAAAAVGTGTIGDGKCNLSLGTSGTIFISSGQFGVDNYNALHSFAHADGHYHLMGCMLSAASCNKWWMDEILKTGDYAGEQQGISSLGENQVYFLPYLMGERSPHNDPSARAAFLGMSMDTTRESMTQAVLEGVAYALRDSLEVAKSLGLTIPRTTICGGGAKSPLWKRIIANVMNLKVDIVETEEGPGYGAAILAAVGCGAYGSLDEAVTKLVHVVETIEPEPELVEKYEKGYQKFRQYYPALKGLF